MNEEIELAQMEMEEAVNAFRHELSRVRTGRASTALLEGLHVNYYGARTPLRQLAGLAASSSQQPARLRVSYTRVVRDAPFAAPRRAFPEEANSRRRATAHRPVFSQQIIRARGMGKDFKTLAVQYKHRRSRASRT